MSDEILCHTQLRSPGDNTRDSLAGACDRSAGRQFRAACQFGGETSPRGARALAAVNPAELRIALSYAIGTARWRPALAAAGGVDALPLMLGDELVHLLHVAIGLGDAAAARAVSAALTNAVRGTADPTAALHEALMPTACTGCRMTKFSGGGWLAHWLVVGRAPLAVLPVLRRLQKKYCDAMGV